MTLTTSRLAEESASYDPAAIEEKWQARWQAQRANRANLDDAPRPYYVLMMFPYPSAEGLHVGNLFAFTGNDIYGRFQRLARAQRVRADRVRRVRDPLRELRAEGRRPSDRADPAKHRELPTAAASAPG